MKVEINAGERSVDMSNLDFRIVLVPETKEDDDKLASLRRHTNTRNMYITSVRMSPDAGPAGVGVEVALVPC